MLTGQNDDSQTPSWVSLGGSPSARMASQAAKTLTALGRHREAEPLYARTASRWNPATRPRVLALALNNLGRAQAQQGHLEKACATWSQASDGLALAARSSARARRPSSTSVAPPRLTGLLPPPAPCWSSWPHPVARRDPHPAGEVLPAEDRTSRRDDQSCEVAAQASPGRAPAPPEWRAGDGHDLSGEPSREALLVLGPSRAPVRPVSAGVSKVGGEDVDDGVLVGQAVMHEAFKTVNPAEGGSELRRAELLGRVRWSLFQRPSSTAAS